MPLSVAGAFHTEHMAPAVGHLAGLARSVSIHDPRTPVISNRDGQVVHDGREVLAPHRRPDRQPGPLGPVPGDDGGPRRHRHPRDAAGRHPDRHRQARAQGRRDLRPQDPRPARRRPATFCAKHGEASRHEHHPDLADGRLPAKGTFHLSAEAAALDVLAAGATIGEVASLRDRTDVIAAHGGQIVEWLVEDGDLVSPGQPLVRLHPEGGY